MSYIYKNEYIRCLLCGSRVKVHDLNKHRRYGCRKTGTAELVELLARIPMTLSEFVGDGSRDGGSRGGKRKQKREGA